MSKAKYPAVEVTWEDSARTIGWNRPDENEGVSTIRSVGLLVSRDKRGVTLTVAHADSGRLLDPLTIPAASVKRVRRLK